MNNLPYGPCQGEAEGERDGQGSAARIPPTPTWAGTQGLWEQGLGAPEGAEEKKHLAFGGVAWSSPTGRLGLFQIVLNCSSIRSQRGSFPYRDSLEAALSISREKVPLLPACPSAPG